MDVAKLEAMVGRDALHAVTDAVTDAVHDSYRTRPGPRTADEIKRRFTLAVRVFRVLHGDLKWSLGKIRDHLATYLRCELDGVSWEPSKRTVWLSDG